MNVAELLQAAHARGVGVYPLALAYAEARSSTDALLLGYASLSESEMADYFFTDDRVKIQLVKLPGELVLESLGADAR